MPDATPAPVAHTPTSGPWQSQHDFDLAGELTIIGNVDGEIINGHTHHTYTLVADVYDNDSAKEDRANARLIVASANSYMKHCADPIAAAEGDLLGEMTERLRWAIQKLDDCGESVDFSIGMARSLADCRAILSRAGKLKGADHD